jgi:Ni/Co efflux regulator RcnB
MKKVFLALALFAFVGASSAEAATFNGGNDKEKTEKKAKKNKKNKKNCTTEEMKACGPKDGASATGGKSCCAKKASASTQTPVAE